MSFQALTTRLAEMVALGGPVIALLLLMSVGVVAVILFKIWQFQAYGVGRHRAIDQALAYQDAGFTDRAAAALSKSRNHLAPVLAEALTAEAQLKPRLIAMAEARLAHVERGFRLLDSVAQLAPLLGLFGTALGMIDAFRALQAAGDAVDPSVLAGGIWVALLTTAAGLAVAMPTSLALTWFEERAARDRAKADLALETLFHPIPRAVTEPAPGPAPQRLEQPSVA